MAELYLVEFKGSRKEYFYNTYYHALHSSEMVVIQAEQGEDVGIILQKIDAELEFEGGARPRSILRPAGDEDQARFHELRELEREYKEDMIERVKKHGLIMKVVDVECQFDGSKITFYFTADKRVDFRALVRDLASRYKTRIELRQIGVRDEARRIGGFGICGRRQCCNTHIQNFKPISTQHARDQDLSLNPSKISGNCGRLLCCLRYETEQYITVKKRFPDVGTRVKTTKGTGVIERIDIFEEKVEVIDDDKLRFTVAGDEILEQVGRRAEARRPSEEEVDEEELRSLEDENNAGNHSNRNNNNRVN
jgi:cell fate regulator YaaT (PSP1 superfamily)